MSSPRDVSCGDFQEAVDQLLTEPERSRKSKLLDKSICELANPIAGRLRGHQHPHSEGGGLAFGSFP